MAEPVDGRGVDPVDAGRDRMLDGRDRIRIVLASPAVGPTAAADGPCAEADLADRKPAPSKRTCEQGHDASTLTGAVRSVEYDVAIAEMSRSGTRAATWANSSRVIAVSGTLECSPGARW